MDKIKSQNKVCEAYPVILILSVVVFVLSWPLIQSIDTASPISFIKESNILSYAVSLCIFALSFLSFRLLFSLLPENAFSVFNKKSINRTVQFIIIGAIVVAIGALLLNRFFVSELSDFGVNAKELPAHKISVSLLVPLCGCVTLVGFYGLKRDLRKPILVYLGYSVAVIITFFSLLYVDIMASDYYHGVAYTETILNTYNFTPFDITTSGIYGHYGLVYAPLMWFLGGSADSLSFLIALVGAFSTLMCVYVIHSIIKNDILRIFSVLGCIITISTMRVHCYFQAQPHRIVFPLVFCAYVTYLCKHNRFALKNVILGYLIGALSIVWNTETGIFCVIAFTVALLLNQWKSHKWCAKESLLFALKLIVFCIGALFTAMVTVNVYNVLCGGKIIIKDFFFPLFESAYMNGVLRYDVQFGNNAWVYVLVLLGITLLYSIYHTTFSGKTNGFCVYSPVLGCIAVAGLLNYSYYVNRAAYMNLDVICQLSCIAIGYFADKYIKGLWSKERKSINDVIRIAFSAVSYVIIACLAANIVLSYSYISGNINNQRYSKATLTESAQRVREELPEGILAVGYGLNLIYQELGWKNQGYYRDISDVSIGSEASDKIISDLKNANEFAVVEQDLESVMNEVLVDSRFVLYKSFPLANGILVRYYTSELKYSSDKKSIAYIGGLANNSIYEQRFRVAAPASASIKGLSLLTATYGRANDSKINVELVQDDKVIASKLFDASFFADNQYAELLFDNPIKLSDEDGSIDLVLRITGVDVNDDLSDCITLGKNAIAPTDDTYLTIDGAVQDGNLVFDVLS